MSAIPSIIISNVLVAEIEKNSMLLPILISSEKNKERTIKTKALLDTGAGGNKTLYWQTALGHGNWKNTSWFTMWMEPKTKLGQSLDMHSMV